MKSIVLVFGFATLLAPQARAAVIMIEDISSGPVGFGPPEMQFSRGFSRYDLTPGLNYHWTRANTNDLDYDEQGDSVTSMERDKRGVPPPRKPWSYSSSAAGTGGGEFYFTVDYNF